jgi:hypothetical protein
MLKEATMLYHVKDLTPEQRQAAQILLGRPVAEDEAVSIRIVSPAIGLPPKLSPQERIEAFKALEERFSKMPRPDVTEDEEDAAFVEAMRSVRPNFRPVR